jgi:hypothetical protein
LLGLAVTDPDANALRGIAITGLTGSANGAWQYSTANGHSWKPIAPVSAANALLLREGDKVRFLPARDFNGSATLTYHAWDQTRGSAGGRADLTLADALGGSSPFSTAEETAGVTVTPVDDAPVLNTRPKPVLRPLAPGETDPAGDAVASLLGMAATDVDGDPVGMAVIGATGTGAWQRQVGGAGAWIALGPASVQNPALLGPTDLIRFVPAAGFTGVAKLSYKAWDGTAVSKTTESATLLINNVDDRPVLDTKGNPTLTPVLAGATDPAGDLVSALLGQWATDPDPGAELGIAVTGAQTVGGTWQVSRDGVTWSDLGAVSTRTPKLLHGTDRIRFVPSAGFTGVAKLTYKAWDAASADPNGTAALSLATGTAVVSVNDAPVLKV